MSLEQTIVDNTAAMLALTAALQGFKPGVTVNNTPGSMPAVAQTQGQSVAEVVGAVAGAVVAETAAAPAAGLVQVAVIDVINLATQLMTAKGKPALQEALKVFNVKSIQAIPADKLADALKAIKSALDAK